MSPSKTIGAKANNANVVASIARFGSLWVLAIRVTSGTLPSPPVHPVDTLRKSRSRMLWKPQLLTQ
jgi:hypothetical protein